jgi:hypothetical protein
VLPESIRIFRVFRKGNTQTEQPRRDDSVLLVVLQRAPLRSLRQLSAFEADGVNNAVAGFEFSLEFRAGYPAPLQFLRIYAVDVFAGPCRRSPFEAGVVE